MTEKKKAGSPAFPLVAKSELAAVIHGKLDWVRRHAHPGDFFHLQLDVSINPVIREYTATREEFAAIVEILKRLFERGAHGRDLGKIGRAHV